MANNNNNNNISCGCSITGIICMVLAFCVSWYFNHSVAWGILHGILGIFYLAYKVIWWVVTNL